MATIIITRSFTDFLTALPPLLSVHLPSSIEFTFDRGTEIDTYAEVEINGYSFRAIKTQTVGTEDNYILGGEMFTALLGLPIFNPYDFIKTQLAVTVICKGYLSAGGAPIATTTHDPFKICNAISANMNEGLLKVQSSGRSKKVYHDGYISYFDVLNQQYKFVPTTVTGLYTADGCSFDTVYIPPVDGMMIFWLNADGCYDRFTFTELTTKRESKLSNPVSLYANYLSEWKGVEVKIQNEIEEDIMFRTIAKDVDHYQQLYFISQSPFIMNSNGELFEMGQRPAQLNTCKQNLNFTFSLKRKIHAQSY